VAPTVRTTILAELPCLFASHEWGCEGFDLWESSEGDERLQGWFKPFLIGYTAADGRYVEVPPEEAELLAWRDIRVSLNALAHLSHRYGIDWDVDLAGEPVGRIMAGQLDERLQGLLRNMGTGLFDTADPELEAKARALLAKHAARN
jgi:hypothetical protein